MKNKTIFEKLESNVRAYCRSFPTVFVRAKNAVMFDAGGRQYIDFLAGAGALNYGHNNDFIRDRMVAHMQSDGITHALDLHTGAKAAFMEALHGRILKPRGLKYKMQFCGPTGSNAVEAALKIARKVTGRPTVFSFMGGFHGMSLGSLAVTGHKMHRAGAGAPLLTNAVFMPFPHGFMNGFDTLGYMEAVLDDPHSGIETPAAVIYETVQAEGGVIPAPPAWQRRLRQICDRHGILLICDDIQIGCGRCGRFFSFEAAGIVPDIVALSKSISGGGLPMSMVLLKPALDIWQPAEHNGSFRGNQLAFVGGEAALEYRDRINLDARVRAKAAWLGAYLGRRVAPLDRRIAVRGLGLIRGIDLTALQRPDLPGRISALCFKRGLVMELAGRNDQVLKILPPLTIEDDVLEQGCDILARAMEECLARPRGRGADGAAPSKTDCMRAEGRRRVRRKK